MEKSIDYLYCILPFEKKFVEDRTKIRVDYVGHPLIDEIKNGSWIIKKNETIDMFCNDPKKMWRENMKQMDEKFKIWSNAPEDPQNN